jgi:RNA polymerase sigma factor (sigma-70 family)
MEPEFEEFCTEMLPRLVGIGKRITGSQLDGEDIAIETLTRAYLRWNRLRRSEWRAGWVLRVASNQAIDLVRRGRLTIPTDPVGTADAMQSVEDRVVLVSVLSRLPRRQREAVTLTYLCDLSQIQVAHAMRVSEGTVKTHLHRGVQSLRDILRLENLEALNGTTS